MKQQNTGNNQHLPAAAEMERRHRHLPGSPCEHWMHGSSRQDSTLSCRVVPPLGNQSPSERCTHKRGKRQTSMQACTHLHETNTQMDNKPPTQTQTISNNQERKNNKEETHSITSQMTSLRTSMSNLDGPQISSMHRESISHARQTNQLSTFSKPKDIKRPGTTPNSPSTHH